MASYTEAEKAQAVKNGEKTLRVLWDCMNQLGAVPVSLVVATFDEEIVAMTPPGLTSEIPLEKWIEIWPGNKPSGQLMGKTGQYDG